MYQFPSSPSNETDAFHQSKSVPPSKKKHFKAILVANILLALFVASIVWFLFFFDSTASSTISKLPITQKSTQTPSGSFTPIVIEDNQELPPINAVKTLDTQAITKVITPQQKLVKSEVKTIVESVPITNKQPEKMSAVDIITKELEKTQLKKAKTTDPNPSLSHGRSLKIGEISEKNNHTELNQVIIEKNTDTLLEKTLLETTESLSDSEHILVKQLESIIVPSSNNENKKEKASNSDIHNSISLQKSKDIDKIMAAMGSIKKSPLTASIEKIENKVTYLLATEKNKYRNTGQYEKKLEPEAKLNNNEMRILTVKKGEAIWDIAVRAYGDGNKYKKILDANPLIKKTPALLKAGITLRVPL